MATDRVRPLYEINRLASDELSYELTCRGCTGTGTVADMRAKLRIMFKPERKYNNEDNSHLLEQTEIWEWKDMGQFRKNIGSDEAEMKESKSRIIERNEKV
ncbi:hypothetical protein FQA39_LY08364 [Lamprigera yunnana]|nr:hypothetical protein FQA39_LY08364 [Lamprigera yunnana]